MDVLMALSRGAFSHQLSKNSPVRRCRFRTRLQIDQFRVEFFEFQHSASCTVFASLVQRVLVFARRLIAEVCGLTAR